MLLDGVNRSSRRTLSGRLRRYWNETGRPLTLTKELISTLENPTMLSVPDKQNALLQDVAKRSTYPGESVELTERDGVVFDASHRDELRYHLETLIERELLKATRGKYTVSAKGWDYMEHLTNPTNGNRSDFFVAMAFKDELAAAWKDGIQPGAMDAGYVAKRVDTDPHNGRIDDRILAGIRSSYGVIADVTTQNAGAYFEAGFAIGLGRPVVWTVRKDEVTKLHFDTRQFIHLVWEDEPDLRNKLSLHLQAVFGRGPASST